MHNRKLLLVVVAIAVAAFSVGLRGQGLTDGIKVDLPHPVTIGDKVLEPGEYEIRRPSSANRDILQIFNKDKMVYETNVLTVPTGADDKDAKETKVVLHHIGDAYYFDRIWMEDRNYGWEFPLPERARALQRETALNVPAARYEPAQQQTGASPQVSQQTNSGPGLAAQLDAIAAQQDREQQAALTQSENQANADRQAQLERDRQAELDRQAQLDRERADRDRVAALQPEPAPAAPQSEARVTEPRAEQRSEQSLSEVPEQLPETATNWFVLLIGGLALVTLSFFARPARASNNG
jgi:hypothetical protein